MSKKWDVYVYGDVNIDLVIPGVTALPLPGEEDEVEIMETFVGGGAALFTLGVGKLGLTPVFQGSVGNDFYGEFIRREFLANGIDDSLLAVHREKKTGISISFTNETDRGFLTYRGSSEGLDVRCIKMDQVAQARHIHVTGYAGAANHREYLDLLSSVKRLGNVTVSFDVGWDSSGAWNPGIRELFPYIDVLFMNETESVHYSRLQSAEEAAAEFAKTAGMAVIKLGKKGALVQKGAERFFEPSFSVKAVDTTGAGDSFNAGFISAFLKGKDIRTCLLYGNACGALSVTANGGNTGFPKEKELLVFLEKNGRTV